MKLRIYSVAMAMQSTNRRSLLGGLAVAILALPFTGCGRSDIQVYRVAKEQQPATAHSSASAAVPAGWEEAARGEMRVASYRIRGEAGKTAEVSVIPLPGGAGREVDNVNRWRSAVGLPEVSESELPKLAQTIQVGGKSAPLYELAGETPGSGEKERMLVAIVRREDTAWFFKMLGDDQIVAKEKPAFVSYLNDFNFNSAGSSGGSTSGSDAQPQLPPSHPPIGAALGASAPVASAASTEGRPNWQVPAGWKEIPGGQFLVAKFSVPGAGNNSATVNVSSSAGSGGGVAMNVNRWRGQLGLNELPDADVNKLAKPVDIAGGKATLVDMIGTDPKNGQKTRLLAAVVPQNNQTWFYKLMGPEATVGETKDAFLAFIKSAKYNP